MIERKAKLAGLVRSHQSMKSSSEIGPYSFEEYRNIARSFHGYPGPGLLVGGYMVALAYRHLPKEGLFDAVCETAKCLPDAIQLLTPCTIGNGWLRIIESGDFALTLYDKTKGNGIRVFLDLAQLNVWPEIREWFLKQEPKEQQNQCKTEEQIREAKYSVCSWSTVNVDLPRIRTKRSPFATRHQSERSCLFTSDHVCPACRETKYYVEVT